MSELFYKKSFALRAVVCFFIIMALMLSCVLRVFTVTTKNYNQIQTKQSRYVIEVSKLRGTIYDCNMVPITNSDKQIVAAVTPNSKAIRMISGVLNDDALYSALETLKNNMPVVCNVDKDIICEGIATTTVYKRYGNNYVARHILGYTDATGHGVSGIELAYDDVLYSNKKVTAVFTGNGKGNVLKGIAPEFENDVSQTLNGVVTTLDINIQNIVENAGSKLNSGCIVVSEVGSNKIKAMVSEPQFDIQNISNFLNAPNSPMLNRALCCFNVGSVFKPCVAATALENGCSNFSFNCTGATKIIDRMFRCHNLSGHGNMVLKTALAQSCNCFFYNLAINLGRESIYKTAAKLSLASKIKLADNIYTAVGVLPKTDSLKNDGALANLSIGQGNLMASPVAMLNLYQAIADNGCYYMPSVVEKVLKDGKQINYDIGSKTQVMSDDTATKLRDYLQEVITDGTGTDAQPTRTSAAGKTATAQTGRYYQNGQEITNSWFCGFFPADEPQYVIIVLSDTKTSVSTASIFAEIADKIAEYKGINFENNG